MAITVTDPFLQLTMLLVLATLSHFTFRRFRQPTILGEIAIGVALGPTVLSALGMYLFGQEIILFDETFIGIFASLGAIFLLFVIGLEIDFRAAYTRKNFFVALGGVLLPLVAGFIAAYLMVPSSAWGASGNQALVATFVGASLVATSTAIAAAVLRELGLVRLEVAKTIMGAALVDDILGLLVLSMVVGMSAGAVDPVALAIVAATAVVFVVVAILVGIYFFSRIVIRIQVAGLRLGLKHGGFLIALAIAFLYAFVAELVGLSAIIGAFLAGTMFASAPLRDDFVEGTGYLGAVFTPVFFIALGLQVNVWAIDTALIVFAVVLAVTAIITKFYGCGIPAKLTGLSKNEASAVGWGMTPRGEIGLIVASTALTAAVIGDGLFSIIVLVMIVISVVPAPFLRKTLLRVAREKQTLEPAQAEAPAN